MKYLFILLLFCASLLADEIQLKNQFYTATPGSYVVTEQGKTYALLYVREKSNDRLVIEEVAIPASNFARQKMSWRNWFESGAPGNTLWTVSQINLETGKFEETFSYTHGGFVDMSDSNSFLTTLLNLRFSEVPEPERKRVGLPPGVNRQDTRPIWNPRIIVDGTPLTNVQFVAFRTYWPSDHSELACKPIDIYIPQAVEGATYPIFFPYVVEVEGKVGSAKLRVVDSGQGVHSPKQPHKPPVLSHEPMLTDEGLYFEISTEERLSDFLITAEETDSPFGLTIPLPSTATQQGTLLVQKEQLECSLTPGESYRFQIYPKNHPELSVETSSILFKSRSPYS